MVSVYGDKNGFDWKLNEALGMQIVKLPMLYPLEKSARDFQQFLGVVTRHVCVDVHRVERRAFGPRDRADGTFEQEA